MEPSRSAGLFKKGRAALFSAAKETVVRAMGAGAKAEADPARRVRAAVIFIIIFSVKCFNGKKNKAV